MEPLVQQWFKGYSNNQPLLDLIKPAPQLETHAWNSKPGQTHDCRGQGLGAGEVEPTLSC